MKFYKLLVLTLLLLVLLIGMVALFSVQVSAQPATVLLMHFDGDVNDSSGNNLHGAWLGPASYTSTSVSGQALDLSGTSYVSVNHNPLLGGMSQVTVDVWAKKATAAMTGTIISKHLQYAISIGGAGGDIACYVGNQDGTLARPNAYNVSAIQDTDWHHYVLAYNGSMVRLFVDGELLAERPLTGTVGNNSDHNLYIGASFQVESEFEGQLDELIIYEGAPDIDPPYFDGYNPAPGENWVEPDTNVTLYVKDNGKGVLQSTIAMTVEGSSLVAPTISGTPANYTITYDPPANFAYDQEVNVAVEATDVDNNSVRQDYAFTIRAAADTIPPRGYFYVEDTGTANIVKHNAQYVWD